MSQRSSAELTITNVGGTAAIVEITTDPPFTVEETRLELGRGASHKLIVNFVPEQPGSANGLLRAGPVEVALAAEALAVPECTANGVCLEAHFDFDAPQCVETRKPEAPAGSSSCPSPRRRIG